MTTSMTSAALAVDLGDGERLVQVPVEVGAQLAEPGARVDVIGEVAIQEPDDSAARPHSMPVLERMFCAEVHAWSYLQQKERTADGRRGGRSHL